jgi:hypothetical protein
MLYAGGFYKYDNELFYAAYFVRGPDFELLRESKDTYTYPHHGWYWFDSLEDACFFFKLNRNDYLSPSEEEINGN